MKIFLYEPDLKTGDLIAHGLTKQGYDVTWIKEYIKAEALIKANYYDASIIEIDDKPASGLNLIKSWFSRKPKALCISIYREEDTCAGFEASRLGSQEIYEVNFGNMEELDNILHRYKITARLPQIFDHTSEAFNMAVKDLRSLTNHGKPVLLTGESGCGKSYLAEHIHDDGHDRLFRYEEIKCGNLTGENAMESLLGVKRGFRDEIKRDKKGIIDYANEKGVLYLEDIASLPYDLQEVILKIIETGRYRSVGAHDANSWKPFRAHVIASCKDLSDIDHDRFDRRLYNIFSHNVIKVPPLRECAADIIANAKQIISDYCIMKGIDVEPELTPEAIVKLASHTWPGNYRELINCIETAVSRCVGGVIDVCHLNITPVTDNESLPNDERGLLVYMLQKYKGKKIEVASALSISRPTLDKRIKKHNLDVKLFKGLRQPKGRKKDKEGETAAVTTKQP